MEKGKQKGCGSTLAVGRGYTTGGLRLKLEAISVHRCVLLVHVFGHTSFSRAATRSGAFSMQAYISGVNPCVEREGMRS